MSNIRFTNFARSTLAVGVTSGDTILALAGGGGAAFPALVAGQYFYATLEDAQLNREIVRVTGRTVDSLLVVRGQDNTAARPWTASASVSLRLNAAAMQDHLTQTTASQTAAANSATTASNAATSATASQTAAAGSATTAGNAATSATASQTAAANSATAAAESATAASASQTAAANSAAAAANSATAAAGSATSAATSAADAAASAASVNPANLVQVTGDQTIGGTKTFSSIPVAPGLNLPATFGSGMGVYNGNGDTASSTQANLQIRSWFGIGFSPSVSGMAVPQNENAVWIDVRTGNLSARGNVTAPAFIGDGSQLTGINAVPAGAVVHFAMNSVPTGWLRANGAAVSRTTFAALFAAIGTTYGAGDGSTTFNLPDLRGEFLRGWDDGRGVDSGRGIGSAQSSQNLSHSHTGSTDSTGNHNHSTNITLTNHSLGPGGDVLPVATNNSPGVTTSNAGAHSHTVTINANGGTEARPRNVAMLACIKF